MKTNKPSIKSFSKDITIMENIILRLVQVKLFIFKLNEKCDKRGCDELSDKWCNTGIMLCNGCSDQK